MRAPQPFDRHRDSANRYTFHFPRQLIRLTRRFLPNGDVRVRVTSETLSGKGDGNWTDFRDYPRMSDGDGAFFRKAQQLHEKWSQS